ncbi:low temperature requirement protein LtrA [Novosphingobium hassiacum]|uniref:Low temperature requirement protein LtrA n=1 Tax=Novosphingobium hassiacum TaxID=173676 RepID=A0A7W5ZYN8_9SPHN|nr:low temperature requirement protein A [Novosphingobium hassiacum]MBB3861609.1 low temperature requirement protein LtrA [Novosphingobium hassiacum]
MPESKPDGPVGSPESLLRNHDGGHAPVSYLELFFDLVYVFATTQVSHFLLMHPGWAGLAEGVVLFLAVWWAWMYTTWVANWADPERVPVRFVLLMVMLASMIMAVALPKAFGHGKNDLGLIFAASYCGLQIFRTAFMVWAMGRDDRAGGINMARILSWFVLSALFWGAGAFAHDTAWRIGLWLTALTIEYTGPSVGYRVPGLGKSDPSEWRISGGHMAERCALFVIIALGEGIIVTGASFAQSEQDASRVLAFLFAFLGSVLMWWIYFDRGAARGADHIEHHAEPGRVARNAYTYLHMPIVAGIVITAVADAILLERPEGAAPARLVLFQCIGLLVYVLGIGTFKRFSSKRGNFPVSHGAGVAMLLVLGGVTLIRPPSALAFVGLSVAILAIVVVWEWGSFHGGWRERLERLSARSA